MENVNMSTAAARNQVGTRENGAKPPSAFERGHCTGLGLASEPNPFPVGSPQHNNFEVGRRFGGGLRREVCSDFAADFFHRLD